jgi:hypothetical protein
MDPDPNPFFDDLKDAKKVFFLNYFLNLTRRPQAHYLQSLKKFNFFKFCVKILYWKHYFSPLNTFMRKGMEPEPDPDPYF